MNLKRRWFFAKAAAAGAAVVAAGRSLRARAALLPSDPGTGGDEAGPDEIALPPFEKALAVTLDEALLSRQSSRSYNGDRPLTREELSRLLWAATGVNRRDGHRTTPSAMGWYPVDLYVALPEGVYEFDPKKHRLVKALGEDIRKDIPIQVTNFPAAGLIALYLVNKSRFQSDENPWADLEIGCMVQNLYLEAGALGMNSCVFALVKYDKVSGLLGLKENQTLRIAQAVGWGK